MPLTTLDPTAALIVIDLQKGLAAAAGRQVVDNAATLATAFRARGLPVVLVNVTGTAPGRTDAQAIAGTHHDLPADFAELVPELDRRPEDHLVTKQRWGAFHGTDLDGYLRDRGVTQIVLTGVATSIGVESTARFAHEYGYHVVVATDAVADRDPGAHRNSVELIFPNLGETATTGDLLARLDAPA